MDDKKNLQNTELNDSELNEVGGGYSKDFRENRRVVSDTAKNVLETDSKGPVWPMEY